MMVVRVARVVRVIGSCCSWKYVGPARASLRVHSIRGKPM